MNNDYIDIQNTLSEYSLASSKRDVSEILKTFVPDGVWVIAGTGNAFKGKEAMRAAMSDFLAQMESWHQINAPAIIAVDGDSATALSSIYEGGKFAGRNEAMSVSGFYDDTLIRTADGWKFVRRTFTSNTVLRYALSK